MRPSTTGKERLWDSRIFLIGIVVLAAVAVSLVAYNYMHSEGRDKESQKPKIPYFYKAELRESEISPEENTLLMIGISNPKDQVYGNVRIQLSTYSAMIHLKPTNPRVEMEYGQDSTPEGKQKHTLDLIDPLGLGRYENTRLYTFSVGGDLPSGHLSTTVEIESRAIVDGNITDKKSFRLTLKSED